MGCKYCDDKDSLILTGKTEKIFDEEFQFAMWITSASYKNGSRMIVAEIGNKRMVSKKINYCFMCGRKLI